MIGFTPAIYRIWARTRFLDCRRVMESRVARPFLPAAPGRGAIQAVWDLSFETEVAKAQGLDSATATFDLKQYYEWLTMEELGRGAKRHGLPRLIATLLAHLYSGPRRIRVGTAISRPVYPRRSVLAGCPFALIIIRVITINPIENVLRLIDQRFKGWQATCSFFLYVDDAAITTTGTSSAVRFLHKWVRRIVLQWISRVLKKHIAAGKSRCIVTSAAIKNALEDDLKPLGIVTSMEGEILGVDYAAGGGHEAQEDYDSEEAESQAEAGEDALVAERRRRRQASCTRRHEAGRHRRR